MGQALTEDGVRSWFRSYLAAFSALGRGDLPASEVAAEYVLPLLVTSDDGVRNIGTRDALVGWLQAQADAMAATGYHHTDAHDVHVEPLSRSTAVVRATLARRGDNGEDLGRMTLSYTVVRDDLDLRVAVMVVHTP